MPTDKGQKAGGRELATEGTEITEEEEGTKRTTDEHGMTRIGRTTIAVVNLDTHEPTHDSWARCGDYFEDFG